MGGVEIKGTLFLPDKEKLWLIELTDVNKKKFYGKRGNLLKSKEDDYWRCYSEVDKNKFWITSIPKGEELNFKFNKIKQFTLSSDDIYYRFSFFGLDLKANSLSELKNEVDKEIRFCEKQIKQSIKAKENLIKLKKELMKVKDISVMVKKN